MTVKELRAELRHADPNAQVVIEPSGEVSEGYEKASEVVHAELMFKADAVTDERTYAKWLDNKNTAVVAGRYVKKQAFVIRA